MAAQTQNFKSGTQSQLSRSIERVFDDAEVSCQINLSGRKLKDYPMIANKFDLADTEEIDLSKNRLSELPKDVCQYLWLEKINCYSNVIKNIPDDIIKLRVLIHLNLSRNQLSSLPVHICQLPLLQVLIVSNNKLVSIPEDICKLEHLMYLDTSCNEINALPCQLGDMKKLRNLNVRRNHLIALPDELSKSQLVSLDVSCNKISSIPPSYRQISTLETIILDNNPLTSPPAQVCRRGRAHIFKYLSQQAVKDDRKRGVLEQQDIKIRYRRSLQNRASWFMAQTGSTNLNNEMSPSMPHLLHETASPTTETPSLLPNRYSIVLTPSTQTVHYTKGLMSPTTPPSGDVSPQPGELRRHTVIADSGYLTQNGDKRWSNSEPRFEEDEVGILADRALQQKELRQERERELRRQISERAHKSSLENNIDYIDNGEGLLGDRDFGNQPDDEFTKAVFEELAKQSTEWSAEDEQLRLQEDREREERRRAAKKLQQNQERIIQEQMRDRTRRPLTTSSSFNENTIRPFESSNRRFRAGLFSSFREKTTTSPTDNITRPKVPNYSSFTSIRNKQAQNNNVNMQHNHQNEDKINRISQSRHEAQLARRQLEENKQKTKQLQKEALFNYLKNRNNPSSVHNSDDLDDRLMQHDEITSSNSHNNTSIPILQPRSAFTIGNKQSLDDVNPKFTMRREMERVREEMEQLEQLRRIIESRLKVTLPDDLPAALMDGVVLCHLANHVRPHAISSIHVPSPAVPKLSLAKCRRNVESFVDACRRIGVTEEKICTVADILDEKSPLRVGRTVQHLMTKTYKQTSAV